ncbi:MAG: hypothetical protein ACRC8Y_06925 [Chroococcales cyanobacterium]
MENPGGAIAPLPGNAELSDIANPELINGRVRDYSASKSVWHKDSEQDARTP